MSLLLVLLGWQFDKQGPMADAFSSSLTTLAVVFDFSPSVDQSIVVRNTEKRRLESLQLIDSTLAIGSLDKHAAQDLRRRIAFSYAQIFGMSGRSALQEVSVHAVRSPFVTKLDTRLSSALQTLRAKLEEGKPSHFRRLWFLQMPVLLLIFLEAWGETWSTKQVCSSLGTASSYLASWCDAS